MRKLFNGLKERSVPVLIKKMNTAMEFNEIRHYQDMIIGSIMSSILIVGAIANFAVRLYWSDNMTEIIVVSLLFLILGILIDITSHRVKNQILRIHLLSILIVGAEITVVIAYYFRIGTVVWSVVFLLLLLSIIRLDRIMFAFVGLSAIILNNVLYATRLNETVVHTEIYFISQIIVFTIIVVIGLLWSKIYQRRFRTSHEQFVETNRQKEEITGLYEEILATEEELREQNQKLHEYNEVIRNNEKKLSYMAYYDSLTGLPNRKHIIEKVSFIKNLAKDNGRKFALVFIDLDGFKKINDTLGHHIGDSYLTEIGKRLEENLSEDDMAGRIGGDEFAIVVQHYNNDEELYEYLDEIRKHINTEIDIEGQKVFSSASFGVSIYPDDALKVIELFKTADAAMYKAKRSGKNKIQFFMKELNAEFFDRLEIEQELKEALNNNEFFVVYQPQTALRENFSHGFEALIRWESPKRGVVSPVKFIHLLEELSLITEVGNWVLDQACKKILELNDLFDEKFYVSVNISPKQLEKTDFVENIIGIINDNKVNPEQVELEVTENILIKDSESAISKLQELRAFGLKIALDDFGTGYASLNYLRLLPLDVLKIDKEFVWGIDESEYGKKLVSSIIDIVHDLNISVVAEGVENNEQLNYLIEEKCDHVQGYLISKPMESDIVDEFIREKERV